MKKIIGITIVAIVFIALFVGTALEAGWGQAVFIWLAAFALAGVLIGAVKLIASDN